MIVGEEKKAAGVFGIVTSCVKLNIRREPNLEAEVIAVIAASAKVLVDIEASTDEFYKACTETGIEGFCMKKYIALSE